MLCYEYQKEVNNCLKQSWGRPTDNPKDKALFVRLDNESYETLVAYCEQENVNKMEAARRGIKKLKDDLKK